MRRFMGWAVALFIATTLNAQVVFEPFPIAGSPIPGWTPQGSWTVTDVGGGDLRAHATGSGHVYLLRTGATASTGAVEAKCTGVSNTCNGGAFMRWDSGRSEGLRAYGASSGGMAQYAILTLAAPGVSRQNVTLPTRTKNLVARVIAQGTEARAQFDVDPLDGKWDYELSLTVLGTNATEYGPYSWNQSYADDVKFFDAAMFRRSTFGAPTIGQSIPLDLYSPTPSQPYVLFASLVPGPAPLANGWFSPIVPDAIFKAVPALPGVFQNFSGVLDGNGEATANLNVPPLPALAGIPIFVGGVVIGPSGLLHLFNDERIDLS